MKQKTLLEQLKEIDRKQFEDEKPYYGLTALYEATNLTPQDKEEIKKVLQNTNDAETVAAVLQAKSDGDNKDKPFDSLKEDEQLVDKKVWYEVFKQSPGGVKKSLTDFDSEVEAEDFCNQHDWHWVDENGFDWHLDYEEKSRDWEDWEKYESLSEDLSEEDIEKALKNVIAVYVVDNAKSSPVIYNENLDEEDTKTDEVIKVSSDMVSAMLSGLQNCNSIYIEPIRKNISFLGKYKLTPEMCMNMFKQIKVSDFQKAMRSTFEKYKDDLLFVFHSSDIKVEELKINLEIYVKVNATRLNDKDSSVIAISFHELNQFESLNESSDPHFQAYDEKIKRAGYTDDEIAKVISIANEYENNADAGFISYAEMDEYADKIGLKDMSDSELRRTWDLYYNVLSRESFTDDDSTGIEKYKKYSDAASAFAEVINREARRRKEAGNYNPDVDESLNEAFSYNPEDKEQELYFDKLYISDRNDDEFPIYGYSYYVPTEDIVDDLFDLSVSDEADEAYNYFKSIEELPWQERDQKIDDYIKNNFNRLIEKYYDKLLDKYEDNALEAAQKFADSGNYDYDNSDYDYESSIDMQMYRNEALKEASYGGAYDIEDDMYFTRDDLNEFCDILIDKLNDKFGYSFDIYDAGFDSPTQLYIEVIDETHSLDVPTIYKAFVVDMRKIRKPSDLQKYIPAVFDYFVKRFEEEYNEQNFDESLNKSVKRFQTKINESVTSVLQDKIIDCLDWFILMEMEFPKDEFLADSWEDVKDGIEMGIDPEFEVAEGIVEYLRPIITFNKRYNKEVEEEGIFEDEIELYKNLIRAMNNYLSQNGYEPNIKESLNEAKFGPYKYRYEAHWISPEGKDILLGANNDFEAVENIAINQIKTILESPWESNENKYKIIDSLYIYDSEKDDADVMGISLEDYIDGILSELDSKMRANSLKEDTIKQNGKWVNKGKEGTHGKFNTKKEADAQRKAMFAQGYKESLDNNYSRAEKKLLDLVKTANSDYTLDDIQLYITPKGNINIRTKDDKDIMTVNRFSDDMIDELRLQGYFDSYDSLDLGESLNESKNESLTEDIYEDDDGDYDDNEFEKGRDGCYYKYIRSKSVYDSDGFTTDYTLYMKAEPVKDRFDVSFVTVFGDSDIYRPDDDNYDYETDDLDNAIEWFDSYNGFEDDEFDESLNEKLIPDNAKILDSGYCDKDEWNKIKKEQIEKYNKDYSNVKCELTKSDTPGLRMWITYYIPVDESLKLKEDYQHKDDDWGNPYTYEEVEDELRNFTNNWTEKEGILRTPWEQEKDYGVLILKKHYDNVEVSDGRTGPGEDMSWAVSYSSLKK